jgi:hypothetical protein
MHTCEEATELHDDPKRRHTQSMRGYTQDAYDRRLHRPEQREAMELRDVYDSWPHTQSMRGYTQDAYDRRLHRPEQREAMELRDVYVDFSFR